MLTRWREEAGEYPCRKKAARVGIAVGILAVANSCLRPSAKPVDPPQRVHSTLLPLASFDDLDCVDRPHPPIPKPVQGANCRFPKALREDIQKNLPTSAVEVRLSLCVGTSGHATSAIPLSAPNLFTVAARYCAAQLEFSPALDENGKPAMGRAPFTMRFHR